MCLFFVSTNRSTMHVSTSSLQRESSLWFPAWTHSLTVSNGGFHRFHRSNDGSLDPTKTRHGCSSEIWLLVRDLVSNHSTPDLCRMASLVHMVHVPYTSYLVPPQVRYDMAPTPNTDLRFATTGGLGVSFLRSRFVRPGATFVDVDSCFIDPPS